MKKIAFISDYFVNDLIGGAELTTDAIMKFGAIRGFEVIAVHSHKVTVEALEQSKDDYHFIICNFFKTHL